MLWLGRFSSIADLPIPAFPALSLKPEKCKFDSPPNPVREMIDPHLLGDPQEYQGTSYWAI